MGTVDEDEFEGVGFQGPEGLRRGPLCGRKESGGREEAYVVEEERMEFEVRAGEVRSLWK